MPREESDDLMVDLMAEVQAERVLGEKLEAFAGQWVAVSGHEVVAHAESLGALLDQIDADEVDGVFQVAEQGTACFF